MPRLLALVTALVLVLALAPAGANTLDLGVSTDALDLDVAADGLDLDVSAAGLGLSVTAPDLVTPLTEADVAAGFGGEYLPGLILVGRSGDAPAGLIHRLAGVGEIVNTLAPIGVDVVAVPRGTEAEAIAAYDGLAGVAFAEPNYVWRLQAENVPNDPRVDEQYGLDRIDAFRGWQLYDPAQTWATDGGARLAVIDTGIDLLHPEFAGRIVECRQWLTGLGIGLPGCQDTGFHGTHVTGIAAATADNGTGIAGVAYDAEILALTGCQVVLCPAADTAAAMIYAADHGADVANYSFGGASASETTRAAVAYAADAGVLQIAAAGNDGADDAVNYPARYPEVVAVAATDANDELAGFSSRGDEIEVAAPGDAIHSTMPGAGLVYLELGGTSMAAPHVAGLGALLRAVGLDASQARQALVAGAELVDGATGVTPEYGHGRINVARSLSHALDRLASQ